MDSWRQRLSDSCELFAADIASLLNHDQVAINHAQIPRDPGVYAFLFSKEMKYVGEAKGQGGLQDRILSKHVSGDESHVLQRAFAERFPDRNERREFIKQNVSVKWVVIPDAERIAIVERLAIWLFKPPWNRR